jgi:Uma2 family endonuclease
MSQVLSERAPQPESTPGRKRWTRKECEFLVESELLEGRYELIDGEVISKMGQKRPHSIALLALRDWLILLFGAVFVQDQIPMDVSDADPEYNEPEPDVAVTREPAADYQNQPGPGDLVLVAEVSDMSLRFDCTKKALLYSRAGIHEYWVTDIVGRRILAHRSPEPDGYSEIIEFGEHEMSATLARPDVSIRVADLLPPIVPSNENAPPIA